MKKFSPIFSLAGRAMIALIFHNQLGDQTQFILFIKNVAIAGGLLFLARYGAGELSIDNHRSGAVGAAS